MKKIKTLRSMLFDGKIVPAESVIEVKETLARDLLASGRAELAESEDEPESVVAADGTARFPGDDTLEGVEDDAPTEPAEPTKPKRK